LKLFDLIKSKRGWDKKYRNFNITRTIQNRFGLFTCEIKYPTATSKSFAYRGRGFS